MIGITSDDLRAELHQFSQSVMRGELSEFATSIREAIRLDLQEIINKQHGGLPAQQAMQTARSPDLYHLPGQPSLPEEVEPKQPTSRRNVSFGSERTATEENEQPSPRSPNFRKKERSRTVPSPQSITRSDANAADKVGVSDSITKRMKSLKALVPGGHQDLGDELETMGYFKRAAIKSNLEVHGSISDNVQSVQATMLRKGGHQATNLMVQNSPEYREFLKENPLARTICGPWFEYTVLIIIGLNAVFIGVESQIAVQSDGTASHTWIRVVDILFLFAFAIELGLRIYVFRWSFFATRLPWGHKNMNRIWNIFDCVIVGAQAIEVVFRFLLDDESTQFGGITVLRLLRVLRIGRLFRMGKIVRLFSDLRTIVRSIYHTIPLFVWSVASLFVITYVFAVYFTETVSAEMRNGKSVPELKKHFGSLVKSQTSLIMAVTGGVDWGELMEPLRQTSDILAALPLLFYLLFTLIVVMNVFTGIFLDSASERAQQETEVHLLKNAYQIFKASDLDDSDNITKADFQAILSHPDVNDFFEAINLDIQQAEVLFELLDTSNDGLISCDEFLRGCLRLRGTAKALDLLILSREVTQLFDGIASMAKQTSESSRSNRQTLAYLVELISKAMNDGTPCSAQSNPGLSSEGSRLQLPM